MKARSIFASLAIMVGTAGVGASIAVSAHADTSANSHNVHVVAVSTHSVDVGWRGVGPGISDEVIVYDASTNQLVDHTPQQSGHSTDRVVDFGAGFEGRALSAKVAFVIDGKNTGWSSPVTFFVPVSAGSSGSQGPAGPAGPKGDKGDAGAQGPSGLVSSGVTQLLDAPDLVATGGSFSTNKTTVGHISLPAGTYAITVNAKVAWASGNGEFPQFFVYNGVPATDFSNDLFNVGSGALPQGNASIDSYYIGTGQITLAVASDVYFEAFGYNTDHGAGTYTLESLTITATHLQVASS